MTGPALCLQVVNTQEELRLNPRRLVIAGFTGRDERAVAAHVAELAAIGVPIPSTTPTFYGLDPELLTTSPLVYVRSRTTSGEVEPVIIRSGGRLFLGVGSDHTDRELESVGILEAKAACPKPVSRSVVALPTDLTRFNWDRVVVEASVDGELYQAGAVAAIRPAQDLLSLVPIAADASDDDLILFCGTLPLVAETFIYGTRWQLALQLPDGTTLSHTYHSLYGQDVPRPQTAQLAQPDGPS